jgi:hypothetical protein
MGQSTTADPTQHLIKSKVPQHPTLGATYAKGLGSKYEPYQPDKIKQQVRKLLCLCTLTRR